MYAVAAPDSDDSAWFVSSINAEPEGCNFDDIFAAYIQSVSCFFSLLRIFIISAS